MDSECSLYKKLFLKDSTPSRQKKKKRGPVGHAGPSGKCDGGRNDMVDSTPSKNTLRGEVLVRHIMVLLPNKLHLKNTLY